MRQISPYACALLVALAAPAALAAQTAAAPKTAEPTDSGRFIIRRAGDTVAVERFSRSGVVINGTLDVLGERKTSQQYSAVVAPDASVPLVEIVVREVPDSAHLKPRVVQRARVIFKEDSAAVDALTNTGMQTRVFGTTRGAVPYLNLSFALLEQAVRRAQAPASDNQVAFFNLGGGQTVSATVRPIQADSLSLAIGSVEYHLLVDRDGRLLGARIPAQNLVAERVGS